MFVCLYSNKCVHADLFYELKPKLETETVNETEDLQQLSEIMWWWLTNELSYGTERPGVTGRIGMKKLGTQLWRQNEHLYSSYVCGFIF